ncbi:hypothetical protein AMJ39_01940 [candidate division TA06 bacterium DG_24]|uniref:Gingipain domain-containing protein n=2 Tax=Bacteria division TA06 TaxID=1156500 RepID=A0A0S7WVN9_UNCT6|nr:MAG: hypothetical protein AMJ39_01940 [candidate division TA06 bacterium DG_24]
MRGSKERMMRALAALLASAIVLSSGPVGIHAAAPRWISFSGAGDAQAPRVEALGTSLEKTVVAVQVPGVWVEDVIAGEGTRFQRLRLPGCGTVLEVGSPELPAVRVTIAVPFGAQPTAKIIEASVQRYPGFRVYPCQEPTIDQEPTVGPDASRSLAINREVYRRDALYPAQWTWLGMSGIWRDLNVVVVEIAPFRFNPVSGNLEVATSMIVEIGHNAQPGTGFVRDGQASVSPAFERLYRGELLNFDALSLERGSLDDPGTQYLFITPPCFETIIEPLVDWHQRRGLRTELLSISTTSPQVVKDEIVERYNNGELDYVLLVGDVNHIPAYYWSGHLSDYWYACVTGAPDLYADLAVGRLSATLGSQLAVQVEKILAYATSPPADDWLTSVLMVAHEAGVETKEYIRTVTLAGSGLTIDTAYGNEPTGTNAAVTAALNEGRNIVNYRGPGSTTAWAGWSYLGESWTNGNVYALTNGDRTPIVFNIAAYTHSIPDTCLGEAWLNHTCGAVASLGASDPPYTAPNFDFDIGLFDAIYNEAIWNIGYVLNYADAEIIPQGFWAQENVKMYFWLGDPATEVWTAVPIALDGSHPGTVPLGPSSFTVSVTSGGTPVEGALVCLWKGTEVHLTDSTDINGQATFSINVGTPGVVYVTATKHDYLPYEGEAVAGDPPVTITLVPDQTVVARGDTLRLIAYVENTTNTAQTFDAWTIVELPNGNPFGPVAGPRQVTLAPYASAQKILEHEVPENAPLGQYTYSGNLGAYPDVVWDEDAFDFDVIAD